MEEGRSADAASILHKKYHIFVFPHSHHSHGFNTAAWSGELGPRRKIQRDVKRFG